MSVKLVKLDGLNDFVEGKDVNSVERLKTRTNDDLYLIYYDLNTYPKEEIKE